MSRDLDEARRRREFPIIDAFRQMRMERDPNGATLRVGVSQVARIDLQLPGFRIEQRPSVYISAHMYDFWFGVMESSSAVSLTFGHSAELFERDSHRPVRDLLRDASGRCACAIPIARSATSRWCRPPIGAR